MRRAELDGFEEQPANGGKPAAKKMVPLPSGSVRERSGTEPGVDLRRLSGLGTLVTMRVEAWKRGPFLRVP
ncbi:hypothetical protein ACFU99_41040 [Streptomyces sp. NPDC057654]|uniref:hypothetical protein n=1 Tax=Streptomyces sp. NPDC057654 TaxID=3346196 RepID=UPI00367A4FBF